MSEADNKQKVHGTVAEYDSVDTLLDACRRIRDAGYVKTDAFTPFAVHGIDSALGIKPTKLPWIPLITGLTGTAIALAMQIWMNGINYPYIISGKPYISLPAFIPVTFELTVLLASFGAFFGMWALNGLPKFSNPMFTDPRFDRATDDRFFLYIDAKDDLYESEGVQRLLADTGGNHVKVVVEDDSSTTVPRPLIVILAAIIALSIIPALVVAKMRVTNSSKPRFHIFYDMDFSPAKDAQTLTTLFADNRAMRPDVPGTVARGELDYDLDFQTGIDVQELSRRDAPRAQQLVRSYFGQADDDPDASGDAEKKPDASKQTTEPDKSAKPKSNKSDAKPETKAAVDDKASDEKKPAAKKPAAKKPAAKKPAAKKPDDTKPAKKQSADKKPAPDKPAPDKPAEAKADDKPEMKPPAQQTAAEAAEQAAVAAAGEAEVDTTPWLTTNPLPVTERLVRQGQKQFNIYCAVCHGVDGTGNGLVNQRARRILASSWIPPSSLHQDTLYSDKYPDGKLFSTITNGIRKMPGYGSQIKTRDRWAVVAYVRALQQSRNASIDLVPQSQRQEIMTRQKEVQHQLQLQAEAERKKEQEIKEQELAEQELAEQAATQ